MYHLSITCTDMSISYPSKLFNATMTSWNKVVFMSCRRATSNFFTSSWRMYCSPDLNGISRRMISGLVFLLPVMKLFLTVNGEYPGEPLPVVPEESVGWFFCNLLSPSGVCANTQWQQANAIKSHRQYLLSLLFNEWAIGTANLTAFIHLWLKAGQNY